MKMELHEAQTLAEDLLRLHKLSPKWSFRFDRSKVAFGKCYYGQRVITLSRYLVELNNEPEVRDTILHEIAHALAPRGAGHNSAWQAIARAIGCNGQRCYGAEVARPRPKYKGVCPGCKLVIYRHRRTAVACASCSPVYDRRFAFVWS
jgi:predicted SprT family Zn-dependent metalloprotease